MSDELEIKVWPPIFRPIGPGDDVVVSTEKLEAYISKYYIKKEDVLEAIGEDEDVVTVVQQYANNLRAEMKEKLNLGDK